MLTHELCSLRPGPDVVGHRREGAVRRQSDGAEDNVGHAHRAPKRHEIKVVDAGKSDRREEGPDADPELEVRPRRIVVDLRAAHSLPSLYQYGQLCLAGTALPK